MLTARFAKRGKALDGDTLFKFQYGVHHTETITVNQYASNFHRRIEFELRPTNSPHEC